MAFKSNDRTFEKVYSIFDKKDYFNAKGLAKTQIGNFERALKRNDKGAQQILDKFKGDMGKAKEYITQVISDRKKQQAFEDYKALKAAVDSIQKGKPIYGAADLVKSRAHNNTQKYTMALYSALRGKKFNNYKDIHADVDSLIGESVNEGISVFDERHFGKKGIIIMIDDNGKKVSAIFKDKKNADKFNRNKPSDIKKLLQLAKKTKYPKAIDESVNEGKKRYYQQDKVGSSKYTISYHDGKKKHDDGSDFFDIQTFKNKKDLAKFVNALHKSGYVYGFNESVNEATSSYSKEIASMTGTRQNKVLDFIKKHKIDSKKLALHLNKEKLRGRMDFATALSGKDGNRYERKFVRMFGESVNEDKSEVEKIKKQVGKNEVKFYDALSKVEKRLGSKYQKFLDTTLKQLRQNPSKFKTNADKEEAIFQSVK